MCDHGKNASRQSTQQIACSRLAYMIALLQYVCAEKFITEKFGIAFSKTGIGGNTFIVRSVRMQNCAFDEAAMETKV